MTDALTSQPAALPDDVREGTFIVIAAYNEGSAIEQVFGGVRPEYPNVVVVDDGSSDRTFEAATRQARYVLRHMINRGQGAALQTGIEFALSRGAKYVVTFDADGQHDPADLQGAWELSRSNGGPLPIGLLHRNPNAERYDLTSQEGLGMSPAAKVTAVQENLDRFLV